MLPELYPLPNLRLMCRTSSPLYLLFTVLAFNLLGDGMRDALDPRLAQRGAE
jgi:ABC-type dipeptide/oligopeptide/nickel transport system permease subunit